MSNGDSEIVTIQITVNDEELNATIPGDMTLLDFLRNSLKLLGAKKGCETGHCGACSVIVNGKITRSCLLKMRRLNGAVVETIEGLAKDDHLHPIQEAFIETGAIQCGFCTSGMIMNAKALLDSNPKPTRDEIKKSLTSNHNICRCTGYIKIFEAVELAAQRLNSNFSKGNSGKANDVSTSINPTNAIEIVTGKYKYGDDFAMEGMIFGKILWSEFPYARIKQIDTKEAESLPGIIKIITSKDIPGKNQAGILIRDQAAIASDLVRYIGDPVACVFAETEKQAEVACGKIHVEYEQLKGVFSPDEAAKPEAPKLHPNGNLLHRAEIVRGDVDEAFAKCAVIVEGDYSTPLVEHGFLEPESGIGYIDQNGIVTVKVGTQTAFDDRIQLSEILALPEDKIRVIQIPMGGAFGGKEDLIIQQFLALGAFLTKRPVKIVLSRQESLRVHVKRHSSHIHYKTGADTTGRVIAIEQQVILDTGPYNSLGTDILENCVVFGSGPYYVPNLKLQGWLWYTNNTLAGAMRGFGVNQVAFALEQQMDAMARVLNIDPFEFRLINGLDVGLPTASDHVLEEGVVSIKETIMAAREVYKHLKIPQSTDNKKIGIGVASAVKNIGYGHNIPEDAGAIVELDANGCVLVKASQHEYGQGARMGLAKLASSTLGIPIENVKVILPDTALTPPTGPTTASRQTFLSGNAVVLACKELKDELMNRAGEILGIDPSRLGIFGEKIIDIDTGKSIFIKEIGEYFSISKRYKAPQTTQILPVGERSRFGESGYPSRNTHFCYAYTTQVAMVEANNDTGEVKVLHVISANDVGKVLNRVAVEGQIQGGIVMGLGYALSEEYIIENGINKTRTLMQCGLPTAESAPEITCAIVEVPHPFGPQGAKGFAEAPSLATAPAIINAIYDALGVRITSLPAKPNKVLDAIKRKQDLHVYKLPDCSS
jgi:CO/xanthine dehydrogenase Mo-binding subunit/aerobic-type carbon monoxide dehydrogenase small subunit (CoxS/CutS family)